MNYSEAVRYLDGLQATKIELGLERMKAACRALGHPESKFPSVHVAGTNGKGSTCAFFESIFRKHGMKTGLFTSPHLNDVRERIQMDREMISEDDFAELVSKVGRLGLPLTYFEFLTVAGLLYFAEKRVDIAVIEVGLGGRLDSTNVIAPLVSVITRISMDHQGYLGDTIGKIAFEKAGIIKEGVPVVTVEQEPAAMDVIRYVADKKRSTLHVVCPYEVKYELGLLGEHQNENAALAIRSAELISGDHSLFTVHEPLLAEALASARWPGRLEVVSKDPLVILDGAHNPNGAEALAAFIRDNCKDKHKMVMLGIMADKDIGGIMGPLAEVADEIVLTRPPWSRAADPAVLVGTLSAIRPGPDAVKHINVIEPIDKAIGQTLGSIPENSVLIITGSLYTVAEAAAYFKRR